MAVKVIAGTDTFIFDLSTMNKADLYREIQRFKNAYMNTNLEFIENFSEITYTGKYITAEDGSVITETPGLTKIYITYTFRESFVWNKIIITTIIIIIF